MSVTHFSLDLLAVKFWFNILSATGRLCLEFVVALYFLVTLDLMPFAFIIRATRPQLAFWSSGRFFVICGAP
jgi:hypothetical protein